MSIRIIQAIGKYNRDIAENLIKKHIFLQRSYMVM